ncbi:MAG: FKBP-type peptidyl-prolyl cis-trans isomerase [Sphingobacteriales bacterium]|jgi:FKBP-type peptidyl-prolyl cis-trans isomerase FkpA|nr:FKBP-type peptidyl-prolyl cis-trans isomerase [Sphingobacteriales bacterium]MBP9140660.1 FKBP-type peptidyl-prolyl cis-trans isomerase [Chitinophagales bacterium]MDA0198919.1 FKBP-type peptidyl-prolyl cis-trans isomerase [Bacteroidota bacterium]MBK6889092.1 FKBP-type peptidyl-prolyl cis-trans isomerase [Sphingobacteriales bacterium]MBK7528406.1 FKBP-type peptidyl-prolyl cis-trans isomerase [Sphingobacteriales bacterium]
MKRYFSILAVSFTILTLILLFSLSGCQNTSDKEGKIKKPFLKEMVKASSLGVSYKIHTQKGGRKAVYGDYIVLHMQGVNARDSIISNSYTDSPMRFNFNHNLFQGTLNEGLSQMSIGDSASFTIPVDTLFGEKLPAYVQKGEKFTYHITLIDAFSKADLNEQKNKLVSEQRIKDEERITKFLKDNKSEMKQTSSGLFYKIYQDGKGERIKLADKVSMTYNITLLTGKKVSSLLAPEDYVVIKQIKGLQEGLQLLNKGAKARLIVPSHLAYGNTPKGAIPANSILIYDLIIADVKPTDLQQETTKTPKGQKKNMNSIKISPKKPVATPQPATPRRKLEVGQDAPPTTIEVK